MPRTRGILRPLRCFYARRASARRNLRSWALSGLVLSGVCFSSSAFGADPQTYTIDIAETGSDDLDDLVTESSLLVSLRESAPVPPFGLIERAKGDIQPIATALNSFGYYQAEVKIEIAGKDISDPDLPLMLDETPEGTPVDVQVSIDRGELYHVRNIVLEGEFPPNLRDAVELEEVSPAIAADIVVVQAQLLTYLQEQGYALATVQEPLATIDDAAHVLDVLFVVQSGARAQIGDIKFEGLESADEEFVRSVLTIKPGDLYRPSTVEVARVALIATGIFSGVSVRADDHIGPDGRIGLTFDVQERALHAVKLEGNYSTDLGVSLSAGWSHRNLLGRGEQLNLVLAGTGLWGNTSDKLGYRATAQFIKPMFMGNLQDLELGVSAIKQSLQAYDQRAESISAAIRRRFSPLWTASVGLAATHDQIEQKGLDRTYQLLSMPLTVSYDVAQPRDQLQDPIAGFRASVAITPTQAFGAENLTYVVFQASSSAYFDISGNGRSVVALRGIVGAVWGVSNNLDLPPDQRVYAGGSPTIRGFRYQSIGPLFPDGDPIGGTAIGAVGVEFRQRLFGNFGAAVFADAGEANAEGIPFTGTIRAGAGGGIRYYTPIGAIRADVALPLNRLPNGDRFEIYIGLGQAF